MSIPNQSLHERDVRSSVHHFTDLDAHQTQGPFIVETGDGIYVYDTDGKKYLDSLAGAWCTSLGFSEKRLAKAAYEQMCRMPYSHTFSHRTGVPTVELADKLTEIAPDGITRAFFTCSGSEAVDSAIKFVWYYHNAIGKPTKKKLIARKRAYHGITVAAASLTGVPIFHKGFDLPVSDRFLHTDTPCHYRYSEVGESEEDFSSRLAQNLETLILAEDPDTIGAFIAEPVMAAGGLMTPPKSYFEKIQAVLKKYNILMIADEVICGFGRTGNMWGCNTYDIRPDIITCAKQLSSAYLPIAGVLITENIYEGLIEGCKEHGAFGLGYTYGGHPVPAAVALETLKIYEERNILEHVRQLSPYFLERLESLKTHALVGDTRGVGLLGGIEIVASQDSKTLFDPGQKAAIKIAQQGFRHGLIIRPLPGDVIGICPPMIIDRKGIDELFDAMHCSIEDGAKVLGV